MSSWVQRTSAPSYTNPYYLRKGYWKDGVLISDGYNLCIVINEATGSCIPNCVGYSYGRFMEGAGVTSCNLSRGNAENWWGATWDGYARGQTPQVGAVMCWRKGQAGDEDDGAGHVAIVEGVYADGSVLTSESNYSGTRWYSNRRYPGGDGNWGLGWPYVFQGFIYNPFVDGGVLPPPVDPDDPQDDPSGYKELPIWLMIPTLKRKRKKGGMLL